MQWLFDYLKKGPPLLSEAAVDCGTCQVRAPYKRALQYPKDLKCCQFSPFLSSFAVGALLAQGERIGDFYEKAEGELVATRFGLIHSHSHRTNKGSLCHFFKKQSGDCGIWQHRPGICYSFFCVSENSGVWDELELSLLESEAALLSDWHFSHDGTEEQWAEWGMVMENTPLIEIPGSLIFQYWREAAESYQKSFAWLQERSRNAQI